MIGRVQKDTLKKRMLRSGWRFALLLHALLAARPGRGKTPCVFYGGARSGNIGGPLVKVKRLQQYFPQHAWNFSLVYGLSNAPYLPAIALDWLRWREVPLVLNQNGVFYPGWYAGDWQRQNAIMGQAYHRADYVFWQSEFCRRAADRFLGHRDGPGEILYNAIDTERFVPLPHTTQRPFTFLVTGKIGVHMGYRIESTIAGLAYARQAGLDAQLVIAGWIEDMAGARALVERFGVSDFVQFYGSYTQEDAPAIYGVSDAYVMTKYLDPCPNTVIEALSCGLPVLYSASGGVPELVGEQAGVGLPVPEDWESIQVPSALAIGEGMLKIAANRDAMGRAARERAIACFDIRHWIDRHRTIFSSLLGDG
ncbi:GDP-mannose-dependent alpha-(1-6)-phosphatidylinositol monomannoside mannosyltransferase [Rhodocyclaceae bacterium]|nr:GDP-mannose-dependent alpha-(1-6)-phosphatidylinositol monomannoside mannosyltransferase [Rhodocyclaceae bacterium]